MSAIKVVHGRPTLEELAAVVAVVCARAAATAAPGTDHGPASGWADRSRGMGRLPRPSPHAWRASAWPR
jgi:hypothetical protein